MSVAQAPSVGTDNRPIPIHAVEPSVRQADELRELRIERSQLARLFSNPKLKDKHKLLVIALHEVLREKARREPSTDGFYRVYRPKLAAMIGVSPDSPDSVSDGLKIVAPRVDTPEATGALYESKLVKEYVDVPDRATGRVRREVRLHLEIREVGGLAAAGTYTPPSSGLAWGGKREQLPCPDHPEAGAVVRRAVHCRACQRVVKQPKPPRTPPRTVPYRQDAVTIPPPELTCNGILPVRRMDSRPPEDETSPLNVPEVCTRREAAMIRAPRGVPVSDDRHSFIAFSALSEEARDALSSWATWQGRDRSPRLTKSQAEQLERAVKEVDVLALLDAAQWTAEQGIPQVERWLTGAYTFWQREQGRLPKPTGPRYVTMAQLSPGARAVLDSFVVRFERVDLPRLRPELAERLQAAIDRVGVAALQHATEWAWQEGRPTLESIIDRATTARATGRGSTEFSR